MSHFTIIETKLKDRQILELALQCENFRVISNQNTITDYNGQVRTVDIVVQLEHGKRVGFIKQGDNYNACGDFWNTGYSSAKFVKILTKRYTEEFLKKELKRKGYRLAKRETLSDGKVKIVLRGM